MKWKCVAVHGRKRNETNRHTTMIVIHENIMSSVRGGKGVVGKVLPPSSSRERRVL